MGEMELHNHTNNNKTQLIKPPYQQPEILNTIHKAYFPDQFNFILYLFTCLHNIPNANYKVSMSKETKKQTRTHKQKIKYSNVYHSDNNHLMGAMMPTMTW
jgi:hypothetical protein